MSIINTTTGLTDNLYWQDETVPVVDGSEQALSQEDFFALLTEQLANQDPTKPVDNDQMVSQMTQFTTADGINKLNEKFETFATSMTSNQALQASSLIGQDVFYFFKDVEIEFLRHNAQKLLGSRKIRVNVDPMHLHPAAGFGHQGRYDADGGRFACPIRSEQRKKITPRHLKINAVERNKTVFIGLAQSFNLEGRCHSFSDSMGWGCSAP